MTRLEYKMRRSTRRILTILAVVATFLLLFHYMFLPQQHITPAERESRSWHKVFESTYIYSAFWDERDTPHVKIITVSPYDERLVDVQCYLKVDEKTVRADTIFHIMDFENNGMKHTPLFFLCYPTDLRRPTHVALSTPSGKLSSWLPVQAISPERNISNKIALCVRPLFGINRDYRAKLVEFIAYYQLLGVNHFVFYDYQTDAFTKQMLRQFNNNGISLQLLPWDIPLSIEYSWENGQVASITDCIYRLASSYEFVLVLDIDEFIVPRLNVTLKSILHSFTDVSSHHSASYLFRQTFFCADSQDDSNGKNLPFHLVTQTKSIRKDVISHWSSRAKSILRPMAVILPGIHKVLLTYGKWRPIVFVEPSTAFIHHYRNGICSFWEKLGYGTVKDVTAFRYRDALLNSLPVRMYMKLYRSQ